jgi:uncharacterized protein (DUF362 family)
MFGKINRRTFLFRSLLWSLGSIFTGKVLKAAHHTAKGVDLAVVKGADYFSSTCKAIDILGGMKRFVRKEAAVALLVNAQSNNPGTYTKPEIIRAVIRMCKDAGARRIGLIGWLTLRNYENTGIKKVVDEEGAELVITPAGRESYFRKVPVSNGVILKEARIIKSFFEFDVLINMNITKEHSGNCFSGVLKNLMGMNSPLSDQSFHRRDPVTGRDNIRYLEQCIADLNSAIHPQLNIADSTEFIITNGPMGPGKIMRPQKVIAGMDRVAVESYCARFFNLDPQQVIAIQKAHEHGLGEMDLTRINLREAEV